MSDQEARRLMSGCRTLGIKTLRESRQGVVEIYRVRD